MGKEETEWLERLRGRLSRKRNLLGLSLARISIGLILLYFYLINFQQRDLLWGPNGIYPIEFVREVDRWYSWIHVYSFAKTEAWFHILYGMGILICLAYTAGFQTRTSGVLTFIFYWSIAQRTPFLGNGGDNLLYLLLFYFMFCNMGAYFSIDSYIKKKKGKDPLRGNSYTGLIHNFALCGAILQLMTLYWFSFFYKMQGAKWTDGSALYYLMQVDVYSLPTVGTWISSHPLLFVTGTYASLIFQYCFPFMILSRKTKGLAVGMAVLFHASIGIIMGIPVFSLVMITADLMLFSDQDYRRIGNWCLSQWVEWKSKLDWRNRSIRGETKARAITK